MSYCFSVIIGIEVPEVFPDIEDMREKVKVLAQEDHHIWHLEPQYYMSEELWGNKGSYVVIAGSFNYWAWEESSEFARKLSKEFDTYVMIMSWDEEADVLNVDVFNRGKNHRTRRGK